MTTGFIEQTVEAIASGEPGWLKAQRLAAWGVFSKLPFPTQRDQEWRRFNIRALNMDKIAAFGNGRPAITTTLSTLTTDASKAGIILCDLATAIQKHPELVREYLGKSISPDEPRKFSALHSAFWQGGAFVYIPRGVKLTVPIEVTYNFHGAGVGALPRTVIVVKPGAEATLVQRFTGGPRSEQLLRGGPDVVGNGAVGLHASGTEVFVEEGARLHYISLQNFSPGVFDFTLKRAHIGRDAEIDWVLGMFGGSFLRYDVECAMEGPGGTSYMYGIGLGEKRQQFGQFTRQHHKCGNTVSDLLFKNVYRDEATGVYSGVIKVEKNANGTNAYQANRNLVLSETVKCDSRPLLEIESNDLRCTHGATIGRLDEDQVFYLRSRGLPDPDARQLLIEAFLEPVLARIKVEDMQKEFSGLIHSKLIR
jgi:Fe-S cluster assembly protein SufD